MELVYLAAARFSFNISACTASLTPSYQSDECFEMNNEIPFQTDAAQAV